MKKFVAMILMLALVFCLFACGEAEAGVAPTETEKNSDVISSDTQTGSFDTQTESITDSNVTDFSSEGTESITHTGATDSEGQGSSDDTQEDDSFDGRILSLSGIVDRAGNGEILFSLSDRWYFFLWEDADSFCSGDEIMVWFATSPFLVREGVIHKDSSGTERKCMVFDRVTECSPIQQGDGNEIPVGKPVIYLYPEAETEVFVRVDFKGQFTQTIPEHGDGWTVTASPDGTLTVNGQTYPYLFWEGIAYDTEMPMDVGYCVAGRDVEAFFSDVLLRMGLTAGEAADFMEYWVPRMEKNPYNIIAFQTDAYEAIAPLTVSPAPDSVLRIFMTYRASDVPADLPAPQILPFERKGFTLVEWGGGELK